MMVKKPTLLLLLCLIVVNGTFAFLFVLPAYDESRKLGEKIREMQGVYYDRVEYAKNLLTALEKMKQYRVGLENLDTALPSDFYLSPIMYFLQKEAGEHRMNLISVSFAKNTSGASGIVASEGKPKSVIVTATLLGTYDDFKKVLKSIDQSARLFEVQTLSFSADTSATETVSSSQKIPSGEHNTQKYYFKLQIKTYIYGS